MSPWADLAERTHWVRIRPNSVTGRQIVHPPADHCTPWQPFRQPLSRHRAFPPGNTPSALGASTGQASAEIIRPCCWYSWSTAPP